MANRPSKKARFSAPQPGKGDMKSPRRRAPQKTDASQDTTARAKANEEQTQVLRKSTARDQALTDLDAKYPYAADGTPIQQ